MSDGVTVGALFRAVLSQLTDARWRPIWLAMLFLVLVTNAGQFLLLPFADPRAPDPVSALAFMGVMLARLIGYNAVCVAALRTARQSARPAWAIDAGWWMHLVVLVIVLACGPVIAIAMGQAGVDVVAATWGGEALAFIPALIIARWRVAVAVESPASPLSANLAIASRYLLPALLVSLALLWPLGILHGLIAETATATSSAAGDLGRALVDAPLTALLALIELALIAAIHARVALVEPVEKQG